MPVYTRTLTRHEHAMFNHPNKDIRRRWRGKCLDKVFVEANKLGADAFTIFDESEKSIAQCCRMGEGVSMNSDLRDERMASPK